jgi:CBS domain-containing protein
VTWVLVVVLVMMVVAAAALIAERWARTRGLAIARQRLDEQLGADSLRIEVPARPLLPALLRPPGTSATIDAHGVPVGDRSGYLRHLHAVVDDVRVRLTDRAVTTGSGTFTAVVGQEDLGRILRLPGIVTRLELRRAGLRVWTPLAVPVDADVLVRDGGLVVLPDPVQVRRLLDLPGLSAFRRTIEGGGLRLGLPELPLGAEVTDLAFDDGAVVVTGTVVPQRFPLV